MGDNTIGSPGQEPKIKTEPQEDPGRQPFTRGEVINLISDDEDEDAIKPTRPTLLAPIEFPQDQAPVDLGQSMLQQKLPKKTKQQCIMDRIQETRRNSARQMRDTEVAVQEQSPASSHEGMPAYAPPAKSGLFLHESDSGDDDLLSLLKDSSTSKRKKRKAIDGDGNDDDDDDPEAVLDTFREDSEANPRPRCKKQNKSGKKRQTTHRNYQHSMLNEKAINSMDVVNEAAQNDGLASPPTFDNQRLRKSALYSLVESIPIEDRKNVSSEIKAFREKLKAFTGKGRSISDAPDGNWFVKGMRVSLKPYQMLGKSHSNRAKDEMYH